MNFSTYRKNLSVVARPDGRCFAALVILIVVLASSEPLASAASPVSLHQESVEQPRIDENGIFVEMPRTEYFSVEPVVCADGVWDTLAGSDHEWRVMTWISLRLAQAISEDRALSPEETASCEYGEGLRNARVLARIRRNLKTPRAELRKNSALTTVEQCGIPKVASKGDFLKWQRTLPSHGELLIGTIDNVRVGFGTSGDGLFPMAILEMSIVGPVPLPGNKSEFAWSGKRAWLQLQLPTDPKVGQASLRPCAQACSQGAIDLLGKNVVIAPNAQSDYYWGFHSPWTILQLANPSVDAFSLLASWLEEG